MTRLLLFFAAALLLSIGWKLFEPEPKCQGVQYREIRMDIRKHGLTHCVEGKWELVK